MQAINWASPTIWKTEPCPVTGSDHGPLDLKLDPEDDEELHYFVTCQSCDRKASAGVDPITKNIDLFYEWGTANPQNGDNYIWTDYDMGTQHPHTKTPVFQTSGPYKGQLWWAP